jgi:hypothetical protein
MFDADKFRVAESAPNTDNDSGLENVHVDLAGVSIGGASDLRS